MVNAGLAGDQVLPEGIVPILPMPTGKILQSS